MYWSRVWKPLQQPLQVALTLFCMATFSRWMCGIYNFFHTQTCSYIFFILNIRRSWPVYIEYTEYKSFARCVSDFIIFFFYLFWFSTVMLFCFIFLLYFWAVYLMSFILVSMSINDGVCPIWFVYPRTGYCIHYTRVWWIQARRWSRDAIYFLYGHDLLFLLIKANEIYLLLYFFSIKLFWIFISTIKIIIIPPQYKLL